MNVFDICNLFTGKGLQATNTNAIEEVSGKGYCNSFKNKKFRFKVGDPIFIAPEDANENPKIAIIKHITKRQMWERYDDRELFYSFHQEEIPSVGLMHPCIVHFVPSADTIPVRTQNPGFIVLRVYDYEEQVLWWMIERDMGDFEIHKQAEIDHLLLKIQQLLGYDTEMVEEKAEICLEEDKCLGLLFEEINRIAYRSSRGHHPKVVMSVLVYQQKMRQLHFNLKNTVELARRYLIDSERGRLAAEETSAREEPEEQHMDIADIPCPRCKEKKVGLHRNILKPGRAADINWNV
ncbi:hypothetical protein MKW92_015766 [Papaver armeniacum]|nr:hypothetical protein MKW92_015766 [Papaver armeniacum]